MYSKIFLTSVIVVISFLTVTGHAFVFDPPFPLMPPQVVEAGVDSDGNSRTVWYRVYDPATDTWDQSSTYYSGSVGYRWSITDLTVRDGVVTWHASLLDESRIDETNWEVVCAVYDPENGDWRTITSNYIGDVHEDWSITRLTIQDGIVTWVASLHDELAMDDTKHEVNYAVYDPENGSWQKASTSYIDFVYEDWSITNLTVRDGVVAWTATLHDESLMKDRDWEVSCAVYDPENGSWKENTTDYTCAIYEDWSITNLTVQNGMVAWIASLFDGLELDHRHAEYVIYDPVRSSWRSGTSFYSSGISSFFIQGELVNYMVDSVDYSWWYDPDSGLWNDGSPPNWVPVFVGLAEGSWLFLDGDNIDSNEVFAYEHQCHLQMEVKSSDVVAGPYVEFTSDRYFTSIDPWPTAVVPPSTYIWDDPNGVLTGGSRPFIVDAEDRTDMNSTGFTAVRTVDDPILINNTTIQTVGFSLTFDRPIATGINHIHVRLGDFDWTWDDLVEETVVSQNDVTDWQEGGNGDWWTYPANIVIGREYNFEVQIQCTKRAEYEGITVYHKPQAFILMADWQRNLWNGGGSSTSLTHPRGEMAYFQLNEQVRWDRNTSFNRQDVFLETVSVPVDNTGGLAIEEIGMYFGKEYGGDGTYKGYALHVGVEGRNIVSAELITPTGRVWAMESEGDEAEFSINSGLLSMADLAELGIISGTYQYIFKDHLGQTITTTVDMTLTTPTQVPNIIYPAHEAEDVGLNPEITWDEIWDTDVNGVAFFLENDEEDWDMDFWWLPATATSQIVTGLPPHDGITCRLIFGQSLSGITPEGINWLTAGYTLKEIHFTTGSIKGDFDDDDDVDFVDFVMFAAQWLRTDCGDCDGADLNDDGEVSYEDLRKLAESWLVGIE